MSNDSQEMDVTEVGQLLTWEPRNKSRDLPGKSTSVVDAILEGLDSHAMRTLEAPAIYFTGLSFTGANIVSAT